MSTALKQVRNDKHPAGKCDELSLTTLFTPKHPKCKQFKPSQPSIPQLGGGSWKPKQQSPCGER